MPSQRILFPQWREENGPTRYPFAEHATLVGSGDGPAPLAGIFLDAAVYPVGGQAGTYLSAATVQTDEVTLWVGDAIEPQRAGGTFSLLDPPDTVALVDTLGRPAGLLASEARRLGAISGWGVGTFAFTRAQAEFAASCVFPTPEEGVRGVLLDDGTLLTGDVWLLGDDGVVLRASSRDTPTGEGGCAVDTTCEVIRVDIVGDPLFKRRLCTTNALFETPRYIRTVTFKDAHQTVVCGPDAYGDVKVTVNNALASDTILRIRPTADGLKFEAVGTLTQGAKAVIA